MPHAPNTVTEGPEYDLLALDHLDEDAQEPMERLTLGGEELPLTLSQTLDGEALHEGFRLSALQWDREEETEEDAAAEAPDTLVLTAENADTEGLWEMTGDLLRRLHKSGVNHLVMRAGDQIAAVETEEMLAGWAYEEMKRRGVAGRRFTYRVRMSGEMPAAWSLQVDQEEHELSEDPYSGIFLKNVYCGPAEVLEQPYARLAEEEAKRKDMKERGAGK